MSWVTKLGISFIIVVFFGIAISAVKISSFDINVVSFILGFGLVFFVIGKDSK